MRCARAGTSSTPAACRPEAFRELSADTRAFLGTVADGARSTGAQLHEIMMAQDFQDLTGQVIKRLVELARTLETQLLQVLLEAAPAQALESEQAAGLLNGPVIDPAGRSDVVQDQAQVDELLETPRILIKPRGRSPRNRWSPRGSNRTQEQAVSDFAGMEDLLQDFLVEAGDLLSDVDNKLVDLEHSPDDRGLLNDIFPWLPHHQGRRGLPQRRRAGHAVPPHREPLRPPAQARARGHARAHGRDPVRDRRGARHVRRPRRGSQPGRRRPACSTACASPSPGSRSHGTGRRGHCAEPADVRPAGVVLPRPGEPDWDALYAAVTGVAARAEALAGRAPSATRGWPLRPVRIRAARPAESPIR
jgi:hypothetical protein